MTAPASDKRQHIVETAYALFRRGGYHASGIDRIIAEAGVAKMTMYRHFPSKDLLIVEVLRCRSKRFDAQIDRLILTGMTREEKIGTIVDWYERWFSREDFHGCAFAHALAEFGRAGHPVHAAVLEQKEGFRRRLSTILAGPWPPERAGSAASDLFILFEGATLLAQMGRADDAVLSLRRTARAVLARLGDPA